MIVTAEEAKTKWCPFVRTVAYHTSGAVNRSALGKMEIHFGP
jgi:hypothetical protein